jgi:hypothetical protein
MLPLAVFELTLLPAYPTFAASTPPPPAPPQSPELLFGLTVKPKDAVLPTVPLPAVELHLWMLQA